MKHSRYKFFVLRRQARYSYGQTECERWAIAVGHPYGVSGARLTVMP
jgi:hypothetical protein